MSQPKIILSKEDNEKLTSLYHKAQTTPVIALSCNDMLQGKDWASLAWNEVRLFMDELGLKYKFDPKMIVGIDATTGEVFT